jgi:hypothetical protein
MIHANNGLCFERQPDGSVFVSHWLTGQANAGRADQAPVSVCDRLWSLTPAEWASVVAAVCAEGEDGDTFKSALAFHQGDHPDDDE